MTHLALFCPGHLPLLAHALEPNDHPSVCSLSLCLGSQVGATTDRVVIAFDSTLPDKTEASSGFYLRAQLCEGATGDDGHLLLSLRIRTLDRQCDCRLATWAGVRVGRECSKRKSFAAAA